MRNSDWIVLGFFSGTVVLGAYALATNPPDRASSNSLLSVSSPDGPAPESGSDLARSVSSKPAAHPGPLRDPQDNDEASPALEKHKAEPESPPAFSSPVVQAFATNHPNSPLKKIPADATKEELAYLEAQAAIIIEDWTKERDILFEANDNDLFLFTSDPRTIANDKLRQSKLKNLMDSLWPQ